MHLLQSWQLIRRCRCCSTWGETVIRVECREGAGKEKGGSGKEVKEDRKEVGEGRELGFS